jgi:hypothetical protein
MSNSDTDTEINIDIQNKGLTELPLNTPNWSKATGIFLQDNDITELNADLLPRTLMFLDLTGNPIVRVTGTFPDGLISLVLSRTKIEKLDILPESITELVITDTPLGRKYDIRGDIRNKDGVRRISNILIEKGTIMVDNTPGERDINENSNSNNDNSVNLNAIGGGSYERPEYNSDDTRHLVMIIERIEDETDIKYRVETLNEGEKIVLKQHLEPYEPNNANLIEPLQLSNPPTVYAKEGHAEDLLFEQPVPPGCVYVTIEECGILSTSWGKLLFAFEDKPAGIRDKLRDPIRYKYDLMAHFGRSFHIHYPEAEEHGDRTYMDCIHYPFMAWNKKVCEIGKSGILSLDDNHVFVDDTIPGKKFNEKKILKTIDCNNITDEDLEKLLGGSLFPTLQMVKDELDYTNGPITYRALKTTMDKYAFTQSWSFKMFPGIHYNFSCRDLAKYSPENTRIEKRRRNSLVSRVQNVNRAPNDIMRGDQGFHMFKGYVLADIRPMMEKMLARGVDVNKRDEDGKTILQLAAGRFNGDTVRWLLNIPGIDKSGAVEEVERVIAPMIERAETDDKKERLRKDADFMIKIINGDEPAKGGSYKKKRKTRGHSRRLRKTRRVKRFK